MKENSSKALNRAKQWQIALFPFNNAATNVYFAFYDSLYQYITGGSADTGSYLNQVSIPNNAKFIRFAQSNKLLNDTSTLMFAFSDLSDLKTIDDYQKYSFPSKYLNSLTSLIIASPLVFAFRMYVLLNRSNWPLMV